MNIRPGTRTCASSARRHARTGSRSLRPCGRRWRIMSASHRHGKNREQCRQADSGGTRNGSSNNRVQPPHCTLFTGASDGSPIIKEHEYVVYAQRPSWMEIELFEITTTAIGRQLFLTTGQDPIIQSGYCMACNSGRQWYETTKNNLLSHHSGRRIWSSQP